MMTDWDQRFLELAEHVASWSKDPRTQVGSVVVDSKKRVVSMGYNGFPRGVHDNLDRLSDRETKYLFVAHAERNALDNSPIATDGCTLYAPLFPCSECAKTIIQKGITRVVSRPILEDVPKFRWDITLQMFKEAEVKYDFVKDYLRLR